MNSNTKFNMRQIFRLDIKKDYVVKGRQFEGYRKIAPLSQIIEDVRSLKIELFLYDVVATLFGNNSIISQLNELLSETFLPITVGGGIDSIFKVDECFRLGVDRIALNSINFHDLGVINHVSNKYGRQSAVAHIEAKLINNQWCAMFQNGREIGSTDLINHIKMLIDNGAGELIISAVDHDGMLNGFPIELVERVDDVCNIPVILSGGITSFDEYKNFKSFHSIKGLSISRAFLDKL